MAAAQISLEYLATPRAWVEAAVVLACLLLAWLFAHPMRKRLPTGLEPGAMKIGAGSIHRVAFPVLAWLLAWAGQLVLQRWQPAPLLGIAIPLAGSFAAIRLAVYLLRHSIAASDTVKALERIIAYGVWAVFALYLTGILPEIRAELDGLSLNASGRKVTVLQVLEGIFWATLAVFAALTASRLIEERALAKVELDASLRVFLGKFIRALAIALGILIALPLVGIDLTVLSVFGGALGVGLGLGLQKVASNYVSGLVILLERAIRPGDLITVAD
ncbi:MAG TPA: mechanosensitive ion channel protein MscS, partial [Usitatibacteraceae bacterium]|nr:mechanosensitive ion channel protein MscS [Usitatibacteraceae bacterium]